ncbi:MAG: hypothetical protein GC182_08665 [Rhodopseudomonas sp.]|nr:hypothetical protein [Rhodopseudomonas sp.]
MTHSPPASCGVERRDDLMICERCAFEWLTGATPPACDPITYKTLVERMVSEATRAEASLRVVTAIKAEGGPADPDMARRRLAEINKILTIVVRVEASDAIKALLIEKGGRR